METSINKTEQENRQQFQKEMTEEEINHNFNELQKWRMAIQEAKQKNFFTKEQVKASHDWGHCAIGSRLAVENPQFINNFRNKPEGTKRDYMKQRLTRKAYRLGMQFDFAVRDDKIEKAEKIFEEIQKLPKVFRDESNRKWWEFWK